jgi:Lon protease-like protein
LGGGFKIGASRVAELPKIVPLFPLPNLVLFPGMMVPLHIFEPRYREMVADSARSDGIIGMILLKGEWEDDYYGFPDIFEIGCAGKIRDLVRLDDGRYNLVLEGLAEFRVLREIREKPYRQAEITSCAVASDALECDFEMMESLREVLFSYLGDPAKEAWRTIVEQRGLRGAALVNFLCFHLDVNPIEKQTMLEALSSRVDCLLDVLTFKIEERKLGPSGPRGGFDKMQ